VIGLVIVTHGRLADELRAAMEHVVGPQWNLATVCIGAEDDMERKRGLIRQKIGEVDKGDGVILLTDMFGGTPSNLAISMLDRPGVEVIAGVNLPMLVKLASVRSAEPLDSAVTFAVEAGRKYIAAASRLLSGRTQANGCQPESTASHGRPAAPANGKNGHGGGMIVPPAPRLTA